MAGTKEGAKKAVKKIKATYGKDFYAKIGRMGGKQSTTGGFASLKVGVDGLTGIERAKVVGQIGGSRKRKKQILIQSVEGGTKQDVAVRTTTRQNGEPKDSFVRRWFGR